MPLFDPHIQPSTWLTAAIPGTGGAIKRRAEDFLVEELPAYQPSGSGEHMYLFIEKVNVSTNHLIRLLAAHFGVDRDAIGVAGLKDRRAVTRQLVSIHTPGKTAADFPAFQHDLIGVLWAAQHTNKLRRGHLVGNQFVIRIRDVEPGKAVHAAAALRILARTGVPNRFGYQRFGLLAVNHLVGRGIARGDPQGALDALLGPVPEGAWCPDSQVEARRHYAEGRIVEALESTPRGLFGEHRVLHALAGSERPSKALRRLERFERTFFVGAMQSAIFNAVLDDRLAAGSFDRLLPGDLAFKHDNGAVFAVTEETLATDATLAARVAAVEVSPSGPMWGVRMTRASGVPGEAEKHALGAAGLVEADLARLDREGYDSTEGQRRPLRVPLKLPDVEGGVDDIGPYVKVRFELPRGAFATSVLQEIMKTPIRAQDVGAEETGSTEPAESASEDRE